MTATAHGSVFRILDDWYVVCRSKDLRRRPLAVTLFGTPVVLFRTAGGEPGALEDRCPHRNAPLSAGEVSDETLRCAYHGWRFDAEGECRFAAGIPREKITAACHAPAYPVRERQGFIWLYATADQVPAREPLNFPLMDDRRYRTFVTVLEARASVHAVAENALDVPHTAYLHGGLFRTAGEAGSELEVVITQHDGSVQAEYLGEDRPAGLAGKILAPSGGTVVHTDRFILPSMTQVDYRIGDRTHIRVTVAMTPVEDQLTRLFAVTSLMLPVPAWFIIPVLRPLFLRIFSQDARMLKLQTENIRRFGGERFASTEADTLGPHILRLMKMAEQGERTTSSGGSRRSKIVL